MEPSELQLDVIGVPGIVADSSVRIEGLSSAASTVVTCILASELVDD